ncbi:hypothetical protein [Streptomyces sp. NPDC057363]|uniref:hypothetical protein n=1 Tax=Streptomyces sp. NPDC057363 TaxID=3346107 RepID=UPI0036272F96
MVSSSFYKSPLFQEVRAERAAEDVLAVLDMRGVDVPEVARARITGCDDPDVLRGWLRQAAIATSIDDVFCTE